MCGWHGISLKNEYILPTLLAYFSFSKVLNAGLLLAEYFHNVLLILLSKESVYLSTTGADGQLQSLCTKTL